MGKTPLIVNDVTGLNPVAVWATAAPTSVQEVQEAITRSSSAISIGGGRFSMGGQVASLDSLHIDMRMLNRVIAFFPTEKSVRVQAGIRWCDLQRFLDPHGLSVKIMQTYANFTVGGSLSVNVHGRYLGLGPLILSVRQVMVVLASGEIQTASPTHNTELFYAVIGGYGGCGVIVEAKLDLADNVPVERINKILPIEKYRAHFRKLLHDPRRPVFHNADLYPPRYDEVRSVTWVETDRTPTEPRRLMPPRRSYPLHRYFFWAFSETPLGKWRRQYLVEPLLYLKKPVHWRNYEAGYDVAELEPVSRKHRTYVLQEYFVPVDKLETFVTLMGEILRRHRVNVINVSIRHALPDPGSLLAWARREVFAFVLYYKQRVRENARQRVAVWTRELIDAVLSVDGTYYLPYQAHATREQFEKAYPRFGEISAIKKRLDPAFRFRNVIWNSYYAPIAEEQGDTVTTDSEFHTVYGDTASADGFYRFLQNVYRIYPEDRFHALIKEACTEHEDDQSIYRYIQKRLPGIKPFLADLFYAVPALIKQKREMTRQSLDLLGDRRTINGYVEIGSTGRYIGALRKHIRVSGDVVLVHDTAPSNSPEDIVERGGLRKIGRFVPLSDYAPISERDIASASIDVVTCYIGLHHAAPVMLGPFVHSIARVLREGGIFIVRDHDVETEKMNAFVSLAHTVFNAGLGVSWEENEKEPRYFDSISHWVRVLEAEGFEDTGRRLLQAHDPSANTLMAFVKGNGGASQ